MASHLLGIDNGTTVSKAGLFTLDGTEVAVAACKTEMLTPAPGHHERDMEKMWAGTADAIRGVLDKAKMKLEDIDLFEINEAFAAQYLAVEKDLGLDRKKVNPNGGAIALGHPLGATGSRLLLTLTIELGKTGKRFGIASACIGGGQGIAMLIKNANT